MLVITRHKQKSPFEVRCTTVKSNSNIDSNFENLKNFRKPSLMEVMSLPEQKKMMQLIFDIGNESCVQMRRDTLFPFFDEMLDDFEGQWDN